MESWLMILQNSVVIYPSESYCIYNKCFLNVKLYKNGKKSILFYLLKLDLGWKKEGAWGVNGGWQTCHPPTGVGVWNNPGRRVVQHGMVYPDGGGRARGTRHTGSQPVQRMLLEFEALATDLK